MRLGYGIFLTLLATAACGSTNPTYPTMGTGGPPGTGATVGISDYAFSPETLTVAVGTTVTWVNSGPSAHTSTSDGGAWDSGQLAGPTSGGAYGGGSAGGSYSFNFVSAGTYAYHCANHATMHGVVVVTP